MRTTFSGFIAGGAMALVVIRIVQSEYYGIGGIDWVAFTGAVMLFMAVMFLASIVPAMRASRVDPTLTLKGS